MGVDNFYFKGSMNTKDLIDSYKYVLEYRKANPGYFVPEGITIFCGDQGEGKTLSIVNTVIKMCNDYPNAWLVSNIEIKGIKNKQFYFSSLEDLSKFDNGIYGVIFVIDEIQNYLNSLNSKEIDLSTIVELTQMRKQRKIIIGSSQRYNRMAKPLREQVKNVVLCSKFLGYIQANQLIDSTKTVEKDGQLQVDSVKKFYWFHSPKLYKSYNTSKKIDGLINRKEKNVVGLPTTYLNGGGF